MARSMWVRVALTCALVLGAVPVTGAAATTPERTERSDCRDTSVPADAEQHRLTRSLGENAVPVPRRILARSGFAPLLAAFERELCDARSVGEARGVLVEHGERLWRTAVRGAQQRAESAARLPGGDDRPLYWARVSMTLALRQWSPAFPVSEKDRARLLTTVERASRGMTDTRFSQRPGVGTLLVSGFDPFILDEEIRRGNPSGAAVLALDGKRLTVRGRAYQVQTVVFPVRYGDFDRGMVERVFRAHLRGGPQQADMITTISQGRPEVFDLEIHNGRRRSATTPDNLNLPGGGTPSAPVVAPGVGPGPEFVPTSLPTKAMLAADQRPFTVQQNPSVVEIPAGASDPVSRADGPTPGSTAVEGSGGGYLSNEVAYRSSLLRTRLAPDIPGGHLHTPVLNFAEDNTTRITDSTFERERAAITNQTERILRAALAAR